MFDFRTIAIIGGTGSFGQAMTAFLLAKTDAVIRIVSRDELKQAQMRAEYGDDRVRYLLGDVRDLSRMQTALHGTDLVFHAAALKHVDKGEYDGSEFVKTNITGTENVAVACRLEGVKKAVFLSTDKSVSPVNTYGATKMVAERLWIRANGYAPHGTQYVAVRYGNVSGSRGSVIPVWQQQLATQQAITLTDMRMSRFWISLRDAVRLAWFAARYGPRGYVLIPHLAAYRVIDLASAVVRQTAPVDAAFRFIGKRPGEKYAEELMTAYEITESLVYRRHGQPLYYAIPPLMPSWPTQPQEHWETEEAFDAWQWYSTEEERGKREEYRSDTWGWQLSVEDLRALIAHTPERDVP